MLQLAVGLRATGRKIGSDPDMAKLLVLAVFVAAAGVLAEPPPSYFPPQRRDSLSLRYVASAGEAGNAAQGRGPTLRSHRFGSPGPFSYNSEQKASQMGVAQTSRREFLGTFRSSFGSGTSSFASDGNGEVAQQYGAFAQSFGPPSQSYFAPDPVRGSPIREQASDDGLGLGSAAGIGFAVSDNGLSSAGRGFSKALRHRFGGFGGYSNFGHGFGAAEGSAAPSGQYGPPSSIYGAPLARSADDDLSEPTNYEYSYQVLAADESGAEFGHREARQNEAARGEYRVLLPDGRMQIVQYEADEKGFRPNIRYEETGGYPAARSSGHAGFGGPY